MTTNQLTVPTVTKKGLAYTLNWEEGVEMKLERLYQHRDYHVDAEITVLDYSEINPLLVGPQRTSITKTFRGLISELEGESARPDWGKRLKQAAIKVLEDFRSGDPVIKLNEMPPPEMPPWRITGVAHEGMSSLIYSSGGMGKSTLGVAFLTLIQGGMGIPDLFNVIKGNTLVLDYEASWAETYRRSGDVTRAYGLGEESMVYYRFMSAPLAHEAEYIRQQIDELEISVVLIDSAGPACGGSPEESTATLQYFAALRSLSSLEKPVTTITLAHVTKDKSRSEDGPFGSVYWTNLPRDTHELKSYRTKGSNYLDCALHHRKTNIGTIHDPIGFRMTWDGPNGLFLENLDVKKHASLSSDLPLAERARICIEIDGPQTTDELMAKLDARNKNSLSATLSRDEHLESIGDKWQLSGLDF